MTADGQTQEPTQIKNIKLEDIFTFDELQSLHLLADEVDKASMLIDQNKRVFSELRENYKAVTESKDFESHVDVASIQADILNFLQQVRSLEGDLENHQRRLRTLLRSLEKDEALVWCR